MPLNGESESFAISAGIISSTPEARKRVFASESEMKTTALAAAKMKPGDTLMI